MTSEAAQSRGKPRKAIVTAAAAALALLGFSAAQAAYTDPGKLGETTSWETAEYQKDWGLKAMNSSSAYALGFSGQGVAVGVMDSGALLQKHPELAGDRFHASTASGKYTTSGNRYPQGALPQFDGNRTEGQDYAFTGDWILNVNDSHGTHVTGTVGANRDGNEFHGVAFGADIYAGNTGGTDDSNYGPFLDPGYFLTAWSALADDINAANQGRGGVINNSFGTNTRIKVAAVPTSQDEADQANAALTDGRKWVESATKPGTFILTGADGYNVQVHLPTNTVAQTEYEYFLFNNQYGTASDGTLNKNFVDSAWDAVKGKKVVQVFTTGNRDLAQPFYRPLYPYFNPEAEKQWIAVAGIKQNADNADHYELIKNFNEAGNAKWWTVAAPGNQIYSSAVVEGSYVEPGVGVGANKELGDPTYASWGGTSMAAPHVSGAFGVLMSRYDQMDALQVREVLLTTANHTNPDGTTMEGWNNADGSTPGEGEVSDRLGWGMPDLNKGMYGPGQFLGTFDYTLKAGTLDVWSNNITEQALTQRKREDDAWKAAAEKWLANPTATLGDNYTEAEKKLIGDLILNIPETVVGLEDKQNISEADAIAWRKAYFEKRLQAIADREYTGTLIKRGEGTLVLTGSNTFTGGAKVEGGTLLGFTESFGDKPVTVNNGTFSLLQTYDDTLTGKGTLTSNKDRLASAVIEKGGTFALTAGQDTKMDTLTFKDGSTLSMRVDNADELKALRKGEIDELTAGLEVTDMQDFDKAVVRDDLAFFKTDIQFIATLADNNAGAIAGILTNDADATFAGNADTDNGRAIGAALDAAPDSELADRLLTTTRAELRDTYRTLGSDALLNTRNATVLNTQLMTRAAMNGDGRTVEMPEGAGRLWGLAVGSTGHVDTAAAGSMDNNFFAALVGAETDVIPGTTLGAFIGGGRSEFDAGRGGKVDSDDFHLGLYGHSDVAQLHVRYGATFTHQSRDNTRTLTVGTDTAASKFSDKANVYQLFGDVAWTGLNTERYTIEPYAGLSLLRLTGEDFSESAAGMTFRTDNRHQDLQVTTLGVRGSLPLNVGSTGLRLKGDAGWSHYFGDTRAEAVMTLGTSAQAVIKGDKLKDAAYVGVGLEADITPAVTFGLSYTGTYSSNATSNALSANLCWRF